MGKADRGQAGLAEVRSFVGGVYGEDLHAKRIASLAGATLGVMQAASLAVAMIGQALAPARGLVTKHAIKQVDRLLSKHGLEVWESFVPWVPHQIGARQEGMVAMDWTDFDQGLSEIPGRDRTMLPKEPSYAATQTACDPGRVAGPTAGRD